MLLPLTIIALYYKMFSTFLGYVRRKHVIFSFCNKFHSPKKETENGHGFQIHKILGVLIINKVTNKILSYNSKPKIMRKVNLATKK